MRFRLKLTLVGCTTTFKEELGEGVILMHEVSFPDNLANLVIATSLLAHEQKMIDQAIKVTIEEIPEV